MSLHQSPPLNVCIKNCHLNVSLNDAKTEATIWGDDIITMSQVMTRRINLNFVFERLYLCMLKTIDWCEGLWASETL